MTMAKRTTKLAAKCGIRRSHAVAAARDKPHAAAVPEPQAVDRAVVRYEWSDASQQVLTVALPACFPDPGKRHREGSLDAIEATENAGQQSLF